MGLPSGSFVSPRAGRLLVTFSGEWRINNGDPVLANGTWDLVLLGYLGSGSGRLVCRLSINANSAILESDYPGGNVAMPVGMELVGYSLGGAGSIWAANLKARCRLLKK